MVCHVVFLGISWSFLVFLGLWVFGCHSFFGVFLSLVARRRGRHRGHDRGRRGYGQFGAADPDADGGTSWERAVPVPQITIQEVLSQVPVPVTTR